MRDSLSKLAAWDQQKASRKPPDPLRLLLSAALNLVGFLLALVALSATARDSGAAGRWTVAVLAIALLALAGCTWTWRWRRAVERAEAIYGPGWRSLTKAHRTERWWSYQLWWAQQQQAASTHSPPPSDPANVYSTPAT